MLRRLLGLAERPNPLTAVIQTTVPDTDESLDRLMALAVSKHHPPC